MCKICIFAGTTEARRLVELLSTQPVSVTACVATEYGETLLPEGGNVTVRSGRIPVDGIIQMLSDTKFDLVIDATHPYAVSITESVARACAETGTEYLRLLREESDKVSDFTCVLNAEAAALFLSKTDGNILLTTGSKDLKTYSKVKDFTDRAYARVLPLDASLALCREAGVQPSHILAMQGPFSEEMDTAMLRAVSAKWLVTKDGGEAGGFAAKVAAARKAGANVLVIGRPKQREGKSFSQVLDSLECRFGFRFAQSVKIVGIGPGSRDAMTQEARRAIEEAAFFVPSCLPSPVFCCISVNAAVFVTGSSVCLGLPRRAEDLCRHRTTGDRGFHSRALRIPAKRGRDVGRHGLFQRHEEAAAAAF